MLGISRWTLLGGSYRTMLRFFHTEIPWATLFWLFFRKHLWRKNEVYLLAGDEVVVSKSGKQTYGLERFFSGHFGNNNALQMVRQVNLHIICKLRHDSALHVPYEHLDSNTAFTAVMRYSSSN